ncbi:hypothetical protein [Streptomyces armeniacus]|uniref:hypothetical protein n=1 Tax=Streptomyces armeniacus TaxID=83291 RepID=UPI001AD839C1|nr:hypothetical protein [Streptomyces armeniacus]
MITKLVYVFDVHDPNLSSYLVRVPERMARLTCHLIHRFTGRVVDYGPTPQGL